MRRILIIDDELLIRHSLSALFRDKETEVVAQADAAGGLKAVSDWRFDICFLDIQLPDSSGLKIVSMIRQLAPATKVVMMSGGEIDRDADRIIRENAFLFLTKPFDLYRVKRVLDAVLPSDENTYHEFRELEERVSERRVYKRKTAATPVTYVTVPPKAAEPFCADLLDISDAGTRIRTPHHLEPGIKVQFRNSVNEAEGIVRWTSLDRRRDLYLAGIEFVRGRQR